MSIVENIAELRQRVGTAARRSGRNSQDIELMAVTKTVAPDRIREAYEHGIRLFGENRVQEFEAKTDALHDLVDARWHMIGHLQSNKAVKATELFNLEHQGQSCWGRESMPPSRNLESFRRMRHKVRDEYLTRLACAPIPRGRPGAIAASCARFASPQLSRPYDGSTLRRRSRAIASILP